MKIEVSISIGELMDKISILSIKKDKIKDKDKLDLINSELDMLNKSISIVINNNEDRRKEILSLLDDLKKINSELWDIEDKIRECERKKIFDKVFTDLARSVYFSNDKRADLKREINLLFNSEIIEVKSYKEY
tara:strand:- start:484 stop:882 length:399 start_codon:yes stop_codon:yes gene_type:complete